MKEQEKLLWHRVQNFQLDEPGVPFKFSDRLARENGWTIVYAKRVIEEYKRFIFLCCVSPGGVTPSDPVDQAWHLHLTFTRSYWIDLCKNTLQKEIHHNPTKGGKSEAQKFDGYYTSSQQLYTEKFGTRPPADIWQDNNTRFGDIDFKRVNVGRFWLVRKPKFSIKTKVLLMLVIAGAFFIQASVATFMPLIIIGIMAILIFRGSQNDNNGNGGCSTGSGCGNSHTDGTHGHSNGHHGGDSGCSSGCSGSGCGGCGGGGD
jgi:hypothetical protein